jgi:hypothetical protein
MEFLPNIQTSIAGRRIFNGFQKTIAFAYCKYKAGGDGI